MINIEHCRKIYEIIIKYIQNNISLLCNSLYVMTCFNIIYKKYFLYLFEIDWYMHYLSIIIVFIIGKKFT